MRFVAAMGHRQADDGTVVGDAKSRVPTVSVVVIGTELMEDLRRRECASPILGNGDGFYCS